MSKRPESPNFISNVNVPWYQYFPHLEHYGSKTYQTSEETLASIPEDIACALSKSTQKDYANNDTGRQWKKIHMEELEDIMKLECKSVTGFSALFALSESTKGLTVALWDLESQDVRHYHLGKDCVYVDCSGEEQLCLILTGEFVWIKLIQGENFWFMSCYASCLLIWFFIISVLFWYAECFTGAYNNFVTQF